MTDLISQERPPNDETVVDLAEILNGRRIDQFNYRLVAVSCLATFFDGLDMTMISFTAPYMRDELGMSTLAIGKIFSAGIVGAALSGFIMSFFADRIGRRPTIIVAVLWFALFTAATAFARSYDALLALRFLDGIAIGGAMPITLVLNVEYAPLKMRATVLTLITIGFSTGAIVAGPLSVLLAPRFGWQAVFLFGGGGSLICGLLLWASLPESIRFLVSKGRRPEYVARVLNRLQPSIHARADDRFILGDERSDREFFTVAKLFAGKLRWLTPFIWLSFLASTLGNYFTTSWAPILYENLHMSRSAGALAASGSAVMSSVLGLCMMRFTDRYGPSAIAVYPALAMLLLLFVGFANIPPALFLAVLIAGITLLGGAHVSLFAISGFFYPSAIRSNGAGWASSIAKTGGVFSPVIGGILLSEKIPLPKLFAILAISPLLVMLSLTGIGVLAGMRPAAVDAEVGAVK